MTLKSSLLMTLGILLLARGAEAAGPTSTLYLTAGDNGYNFKMLGGTTTLIDTFQANPGGHGEYAIAVSDGTIRTGGNGQSGAPAVGSTYNLNFNYIGPQLANPGNNIIDGTTDGTYNYGVNWENGSVFRCNLDWSSPTLMFGVGGNADEGITYEPLNNSLWIANGNTIGDYSMTGTLLSSFSSSADHALAYDGADGTLWVLQVQGGVFDQYSTGGTLLQSIHTGANANIIGGEFALMPVPEPSALALTGVGGMTTLVMACRRKRSVPNL